MERRGHENTCVQQLQGFRHSFEFVQFNKRDHPDQKDGQGYKNGQALALDAHFYS